MPDSSMGSTPQNEPLFSYLEFVASFQCAPACESLCELLYFGGDEFIHSRSMKASYHLIKPEDLFWRPSNMMKIPNADYLERTGSENLGARLWRLPPQSANTLHKHIRAEEFYFVLEGTAACAWATRR